MARVTVADFAELKRLRRPQLRVMALLAGISERSIAATRTDDRLRLRILEARLERNAAVDGETIAAEVIEQIESLRPPGIPRGDLAFDVARDLENWGGDQC